MLPLSTVDNHNNPDEEDAAMNHALKQKEVKNLACSIIENQVSISLTFYSKLLRMQIPKMQKELMA